jgi:hypothetical protein
MLRQPRREIKICMPVKCQLITVKQIRDQGVVSVGGELVRHQFRVLPDADYVGEKQDRDVFVDGLSGWLRDVGFDIADFDGFAGWFAAVFFFSCISHSGVACFDFANCNGRQKWRGEGALTRA